ncbi:hypothetical protein CEXT_186801 [Caerostris extrusa]|uniref:Uncharacterized protein n=1 Tax=Caerostris extrusa TaxID=172846 RepID=A0AAV4X8W8_CAEEX|nr:hypothetical protein CEXT_186801 [Caerostris extrusa]
MGPNKSTAILLSRTKITNAKESKQRAAPGDYEVKDILPKWGSFLLSRHRLLVVNLYIILRRDSSGLNKKLLLHAQNKHG